MLLNETWTQFVNRAEKNGNDLVTQDKLDHIEIYKTGPKEITIEEE